MASRWRLQLAVTRQHRLPTRMRRRQQPHLASVHGGRDDHILQMQEQLQSLQILRTWMQPIPSAHRTECGVSSCIQFRRVFFSATEVCARRRSGVYTMTAHVLAQMSLRQASSRGAGPRPVIADCCTCVTPRRGRAAAQAQPQAAHLSWSHAAVRVPCRTAGRLACSQRSRSRAPNIWAARHAWTPACPLLCAVR